MVDVFLYLLYFQPQHNSCRMTAMVANLSLSKQNIIQKFYLDDEGNDQHSDATR